MIEYLDADLSLKTVSPSERLISGYAAHHHSVDRVRDIIDPVASAKAVKRLKSPSDVGVFIGHNSAALPIGIPQKIEATPQGLYTETYILKGSAGDNLLAVAKDLMDHGLSLGMSIGYKTHDSKMEQTAHGRIRRLLDLALLEYSYAPSQAIANPQALVTAIKSRRQQAHDRAAQEAKMQYRVEQQADGAHWTVLCDTDADGDADDNLLIGTYPSADIANAVADALRRYDQDDDEATRAAGVADEAQQGAADKTTRATAAPVLTMTGSAQDVNDLNDDAFLYVQEGGAKDDAGKTTPRSLRHLPYRDAEGKLDRPSLETAIARLGQDRALPGVDEGKTAQLQARARRLLTQAEAGKTYAEAEEWKAGAPLSIYGLGIRLLDLAEQLSDEHKALALLAEETKDGQRIRPAMRDHLAAVGKDLGDLLRWAETIERGEDGRQRLAWFKQQLALTEV